MNKEEYIKEFLKLYENTNWLYESMLPNLEDLKEKNPEEYTKEILLIKEGYYSNENMKKVFESMLLSEDGLTVRELYEEAIEYDRFIKLKPWLNQKIKVTTIEEIK